MSSKKDPTTSVRSAAVPAAPVGQTIRSRWRLPHWESTHGVYFVTFRLFDSLPRTVLQQFETERQAFVATAQRMGREPSPSERNRLAKLFTSRMEAYLDSGAGACHLAKPRVAEVVAATLHHFDEWRYRLFAWCVMPNHVHVVFQPLGGHSLADTLHSWKSYSAKKANQLMRRSGTFWQREYYDHLIRDGEEFSWVVRYVAENPRRAGLRSWPWIWVRGARPAEAGATRQGPSPLGGARE